MGYVTSIVTIVIPFTPLVPGLVGWKWGWFGDVWGMGKLMGGCDSFMYVRKKIGSFEHDVPRNSWKLIIFLVRTNWR